jgi:hypothetical protein
MDWVPGVLTYDEFLDLPGAAKHQIAESLSRLLNILAEHDFAIGDLRYPNILVSHSSTSDEYSVNIIDFEFSGRIGTARYPENLNIEEFPWLTEEKLCDQNNCVLHKDDQDAVMFYIAEELRTVVPNQTGCLAASRNDREAPTSDVDCLRDCLVKL